MTDYPPTTTCPACGADTPPEQLEYRRGWRWETTCQRCGTTWSRPQRSDPT